MRNSVSTQRPHSLPCGFALAFAAFWCTLETPLFARVNDGNENKNPVGDRTGLCQAMNLYRIRVYCLQYISLREEAQVMFSESRHNLMKLLGGVT